MTTATKVKAVPEGHPTVSPYLVVSGVSKLIDFVKQVFGATEVYVSRRPDGTVGHAEVKIGDSIVMMGEGANIKSFPAMLHLYMEDCDAVYRRAIEAGAKSVREPADQPYGDRTGGVEDAFGNQWWIATHVEDVNSEELEQRMRAAKS
jgi:PhnB protein